jgi:hypothetical protein
MERLKIFISWSLPRSQAVAEALRDWLPNVFQMAEPWISAADIEKGTKWAQAITGELEKSDFGIICLTPENLTSPWLLFEAGSLAKKQESRVCTYLYEVKYGDVKDPLSQFQHTLATESDTKKLVATINNAMPAGASLAPERLEKAFEKWWPELQNRLSPSSIIRPSGDETDRLADVIEIVLFACNVCALISGEGVVHGEYGDLINANEERWHRATSCPNTGRSIRMAITPRSKEGQVHYFQIDQPPGN